MKSKHMDVELDDVEAILSFGSSTNRLWSTIIIRGLQFQVEILP